MKTYSTIREAFTNGKGDVFVQKEGKYAALSRHDMIEEEILRIENEGFTFVPWSEIYDLTAQERTQRAEIVRQIRENAAKIAAQPKRIYTAEERRQWECIAHHDTADSYYHEFPDAYGQYL